MRGPAHADTCIVGQGSARFAAVLVAALFTALAPAAASARPGPDIVSAHFDKPPVAGVRSTLVVKVRDPLAAINGIRIDFGDGSQVEFSSCRPTSVFGALPDEFKIGRPASFSIDHVFANEGQVTVHLAATSGDCMAGPAVSELDQKVHVLGVPKGVPKKLDTDKGPIARLSANAEFCPTALALPGSVSIATMRSSILCLLRLLRKYYGLSSLKSNKRLTKAAQVHAVDMVKRDYFSHDAPDGSTLQDRLKRAKFKVRSIVGENIGAGTDQYGTPLGIILGWFYSAPHRKNMLEADFRQAGIGLAKGMPYESDGAPALTYDLTLSGR